MFRRECYRRSCYRGGYYRPCYDPCCDPCYDPRVVPCDPCCQGPRGEQGPPGPQGPAGKITSYFFGGTTQVQELAAQNTQQAVIFNEAPVTENITLVTADGSGDRNRVQVSGTPGVYQIQYSVVVSIPAGGAGAETIEIHLEKSANGSVAGTLVPLSQQSIQFDSQTTIQTQQVSGFIILPLSADEQVSLVWSSSVFPSSLANATLSVIQLASTPST